jgi:3',5'-cyclic AMP phosphodiesterase CpdA
MRLSINKLILFVLITFAGGIATAIQDNPKSLSFAVIGDSGDGSKAQAAIAKQMLAYREKTPFDFVLMLGDNIYGGGKPKYFQTEFEQPYKDLLKAGVKFYAALGNHDAAEADFHVNYKDFNMGGKRYYNFVKGVEGTDHLIEFFALDTNAEDGLEKAQLDWLNKELGNSKARWKVAYMHHSIFSSGRMHPPYLSLRNQLHPLFVKHKVNLVLAGHTHVYERIKPQDDVQYITEGSSGKIMRNNLDKASSLTAVGNDQQQSFLLVHVTTKDLTIEAIGMDGKQFDTIMLKRD